MKPHPLKEDACKANQTGVLEPVQDEVSGAEMLVLRIFGLILAYYGIKKKAREVIEFLKSL